MAFPIRIGATVSPEGRIELDIPELHPGERVSITIEHEQPETPLEAPTGGVPMIDLIKDLPGHWLFKTAEEVDAYLQQERGLVGAVNVQPGEAVYVDANVLIYSVERVQPYVPTLDACGATSMRCSARPSPAS